MMDKDILSQAEIDALLRPVENTEDRLALKNEDDQVESLTVNKLITTVASSSDHSLSWKMGDFIFLKGDSVGVLVNGNLVAQGEMIALNDKLVIRVTEVVNKDK